MKIRPVRSEADYHACLERIERLWGAEPDSEEGQELDVLVTLVGAYEDKNHPVPPPNPIEAIKFVMDQRGLKQADLVPYFGSRSKVSEVLSGKRSLTLSMIRALHNVFDIPAEVLIQPGDSFPEDGADIDWRAFPTQQIVKLDWVQDLDPKTQPEEIMRDMANQAGVEATSLATACMRQGARRNAKDDPYAIEAWLLRVLAVARGLTAKDSPASTEPNREFLREVVKLSVLDEGPLVAQEYLLKRGIRLVVVPHLKRTYLDGAVLLGPDRSPVIGLTLRYDRLDYFWFTLAHELAHLACGHVKEQDSCIIDDLEMNHGEDDKEQEAHQAAQDALIPPALWDDHPAGETASIADVRDLARLAGVHPAIVAGRVRHDKNNYRLLAKHIGSGQVREMFN